MSNVGFFSKAMQKAGETRFIFGVGGGFDYLIKSKFSTSQVRYITVPVLYYDEDDPTVNEGYIKEIGKGDWSEGPYAAYRTKYKYQVYPEIELGLRYMSEDKCYIQVTANWQFINKKLKFANLNKVHIVDTDEVGKNAVKVLLDYTTSFIATHKEVQYDINPLTQCVIAYVEGADECKVIRLRSRGNITFSAGKFINKTYVGLDLGLSIRRFKINDGSKTAVGFVAGVNFEYFFNSRISLVDYTNYAFNVKKIGGVRNTIRDINFGERIRCHF